ncbi:MAG: carboxypeptidase-like regulatory domain-containing protein [Longimicrobiales bacterium]
MELRDRMAGACVFLALLGAFVPAEVAGQTLQGRVLDQRDGRAVPQTLVRLLDGSGEQVSLTISDLTGRYRLEAPAPGRFVIEAERVGFRDYRSQEVELPRAGGTYEVDLLVVSEPIALRGLEVTGLQREAVERRLRLLIGMSPSSIRHRPIMGAVVQEHVQKGHDLADLIRWQNLPSIHVRQTRDGPCFQFRTRSCLPTYLDGVRQRPELVSFLPLDLVMSIVILQPNESAQYEAGGVLLYTRSWLGAARDGR